MKYALCSLGILLILSGCEDFSHRKPVMKPKNETRSLSLQPASSTEKEIECRVLDVRTGKTMIVKGHQIIYTSEPKPPSTYRRPTSVSAFSCQGTRWIGLNCDLYLYRNGLITGMKVVEWGFSWLTNFADNNRQRSLAEEVQAFERDVTLDQLIVDYDHSSQSRSYPNELVRGTSFGEVIPKPYNEYLQQSNPGSAVGGRAKFVSAAVNGELLKITVSDQSGVMVPSVWIDLDTKKAIKAENYEYDPDEKLRELIKQ